MEIIDPRNMITESSLVKIISEFGQFAIMKTVAIEIVEWKRG